jgi:hypothetical protein
MISVASWILQESESYPCQTATIGAYVDSTMKQAVIIKVYWECFKIGLMKLRKVSNNLTAICGHRDIAEMML